LTGRFLPLRAGKPLVIGHRGGRGDGWPPENTLSAFERGRLEGAYAVELDIRLSGSGEVVVMHDANLARMTTGQETGAVASLPWSVLSRIELGASRERIPRLEDVLDWARSKDTALNVEIKHDVPDRLALVRGVARLLRGSEVAVLVSSFDPFVLLALRLFLPRVASALLTDPRQSYAPALHALARRPLVAALHVERQQAAPDAIARWKRRGLVVGVWTVNDPHEARRLADAGVDLIITDQPGPMVEALAGS
jgi:glycerophosphoryl diester phosphodiesterase